MKLHLVKSVKDRTVYCGKVKATAQNSVLGVGPTTCEECRKAWKKES